MTATLIAQPDTGQIGVKVEGLAEHTVHISKIDADWYRHASNNGNALTSFATTEPDANYRARVEGTDDDGVGQVWVVETEQPEVKLKGYAEARPKAKMRAEPEPEPKKRSHHKAKDSK